MTTFRIYKKQELFEAFGALFDVVREKEYLGCMIGPFEDFCLEKLGIIIDGTQEKKLSDDFEEYLKKKKYEYERQDAPGVLYYSERSY